MTEEREESRESPEPGPQGAEELFTEWIGRRRAGRGSEFEDWVVEYPLLREELEDLLQSWQRVERVHARLTERSLGARIEARFGSGIDPAISLAGDDSDDAREADSDDDGSPGISTSTHVDQIVTGLRQLDKDDRRYTFRNEIARGGMGAILRVWDKSLHRVLAMKVMLEKAGAEDADGSSNPNATRVSRFLEEAQITGQLDHPGILPVHETGINEDGRLYFTMPLVKGAELKAIIDKVHAGDDEWTLTRALNVILRVCQAVSFAHSKGVIHRDLKPANIMVGRFGETYVMDWGLAKVLDREETHDIRVRAGAPSTLSMVHTARREDKELDPDSPIVTMDGDIVGTPAYMSPEQATGRLADVGPQSDVYAVGALLYHLLSGQMPYVPLGERVSPHTVLNAVRQGPPWKIRDIKKSVPDELIAISDKAMARELGERYSDMHSMGEDLRAFLEGHVVQAYETGALAEMRKWVVRNKLLAGLVAGITAVIFGGLLIVLQIQTTAKEGLAEANQEITTARDTALDEKQRADENANAALEQQRRANETAHRIQLQAYHASLTAANFSLRLLEVPEARRALEECSEERRHFAWRHLYHKSDASLFEAPGHSGSVFDLSLRETGEEVELLSIGRDGRLVVWDPSNGDLISERNVGSELSSIIGQAKFSADGQRVLLLIASRGLVGGDVRMEFVDGSRPGVAMEDSPSGGTVLASALSRDGARAACLARDGMLRIWNAETGALLSSAPFSARVTAIEFDPFGRTLAVAERYAAGSGSLIAIVDVVNAGVLHHIPKAVDTPVSALAFDPLGTRLAMGGGSGIIRVYELEGSGSRILHTFSGHEESVFDLAFTAGGETLVSCSGDRTVRTWSMHEGEAGSTLLGHAGVVGVICLNAESRTVYSGERQSTGNGDSPIRAFSLDHPGAFTTYGNIGRSVNAGSFNSDGSRFVSANSSGEARIWDATSGVVLNVLRGHSRSVSSASFSPDDRLIATGSIDSDVILWEASTGQIKRILAGHDRGVEALAFSSDGTTLVTGARDKKVRLWDVESGETLAEIEGNEGWVLALAMHPTAPEFAVVGRGRGKRNSRFLRVFSVPSGELLHEVETGHTWNLEALCYSADGKQLFITSRDKHLSAYSVPGYEQTARVRVGDSTVKAMTMTPDARRVAFGCSDGTVLVWDAENMEHLLDIRTDARLIHDVEFSPDGTRLLSASGDGRLLMFETEPSGERYIAQLEERRLESIAEAFVVPYFDEVWRMELVLSLLVADRRLENAVRDTAIRLTRVRGNDPAGFHDGPQGARELVKSPFASKKELALGLKRARHAVKLDEERAVREEQRIDPEYLDTLALAFMRTVDFDSALSTFARAAEAHGKQPPLRHLALYATALCLAQKHAAAEPLVEEIQLRSLRPSWLVDSKTRNWLSELELSYGEIDLP